MSEFDEVYLPPEEAELSGPDLGEELRIGLACRALLQSEGYQRVMEAMRTSVQGTFERTPMRDVEGLQYCRMMHQVVRDFDQLLRDAVDTGTLSAQELADKQAEFKEGQQV